MKNKRKKISSKSSRREWIEAIFIAVLLAFFIRTFFVQAFKIPSGSMMPILKPGDRILVNKLFYGPIIPILDLKLPSLKEPKRSDVIVFIYPASAHSRTFTAFKRYIDDENLGPMYRRLITFFRETQVKDYIKRLIGLPQELVEIKNGTIYINARSVQEDQIRRNIYLNEGPFGQIGQQMRVPTDSYYCLGDNSGSSRDSRYWGFVNKRYLIGKAFFIYWPIQRMGFIR
jgi:signal peptidase I